MHLKQILMVAALGISISASASLPSCADLLKEAVQVQAGPGGPNDPQKQYVTLKVCKDQNGRWSVTQQPQFPQPFAGTATVDQNGNCTVEITAPEQYKKTIQLSKDKAYCQSSSGGGHATNENGTGSTGTSNGGSP